MSHAQAARVIEQVYNHGQLMAHGDAGGLILYINSPLGAFSVRRDGACAHLHTGAKYARDGRLYADDYNKPEFMVPHDYPRGWHDKFFERFVPALNDPSRDLDELLEHLLKEPDATSTNKLKVSDLPGWGVALDLLAISFIVLLISMIMRLFQ